MAYIITSKIHARGLKKPPPSARIDPQHPLAQGIELACPLNGSAFDYASRQHLTFGGSGGSWKSNGFQFGGTGYFSRPIPTTFAASAITIALRGAKTSTLSFDRALWLNSSTDYRLGLQTRNSNGDWQAVSAGGGIGFGSHSIGRVDSVCVASVLGATNGTRYGFNGAIVATGTLTTFTSDVATLDFGRLLSGGTPSYSALLVEYAYVWSRALNPSEIAQLHAEPYSMFWLPGARKIFVGTAGGASPQEAEAATATATGAAYDATALGTITVEIGTATATGTAYGSAALGEVTAEVATATSTGTAYDAGALGTITVAVGVASATGTAYDASNTTTVTAGAGVATATGAAYGATGLVASPQTAAVGCAEAVGSAYDMGVSWTIPNRPVRQEPIRRRREDMLRGRMRITGHGVEGFG